MLIKKNAAFEADFQSLLSLKIGLFTPKGHFEESILAENGFKKAKKFMMRMMQPT
jgi:hypothetical protein